MDEDELLAELEYEEEELAATASADQGGSFEIILVGVLTVSLLVGGSALAAGYGSAGFNRQKTVEGSFGGIKGAGRAGVSASSSGLDALNRTIIAPISWLVQRDVDEGRRELNFSRWDRPPREPGESAEQVQEGEMPQWFYVMMHPSAKLSASALPRGMAGVYGGEYQGKQHGNFDHYCVPCGAGKQGLCAKETVTVRQQ